MGLCHASKQADETSVDTAKSVMSTKVQEGKKTDETSPGTATVAPKAQESSEQPATKKSIFILDAKQRHRLKDYKFIKPIGTPGHFGAAFVAERKVDGKWLPCAVKRIAKSRFMNGKTRTCLLFRIHRLIANLF
jgi:hypothetical protein